ncbi:MAG TPA: haloacid dehalogenase type II [Gemmatimonadales bacterium]|nr:haloacid dehalogenase type II [Gemmatimonadales bacterium]
MKLRRREFLALTASSLTAAPVFGATISQPLAAPRVKALAFDAFAIFDLRTVSSRVEQVFPGHGAELSNTWRIRQFEYQWLRTLGGRYADFRRTTEDALVFATNQLRLDLTGEKREHLMQAYLELTAWPDVRPALQSLRRAGIRLAVLSNATTGILDAGIRNSELEGIFEQVLSVDRLRTFKPHPRAYQAAIDAYGLPRQDIGYVAFAGWDAAGAKWFGYPTFWINRLNLPVEELGAPPDAIGSDLDDLVHFVGVGS